MVPRRSIVAALSRLRRRLFPSEESPHIRLGRRGEDLATDYLRRNGHKILLRNFRAARGGELDIVCRDKRNDELVFVEVKTRSDLDHGRPMDAVDRKKRHLIIRGAMAWLRMLNMPDITFRFDVIEVHADGTSEIIHIENAFQLPEYFIY